jgi:hypothetical protein
VTASRQISLPGGLQPRCLHLVLCNTQATLETRVCHSRAYFNSHPTPLLSSYLLLTSSSPFPFSLLPLTHSPPCRRNRPLLLECPRMLPHKVCNPSLSFGIDGTPSPVVCSRLVALLSFLILLQHSRSCFPSFTILFNFRSLHSSALFFLIFLSPVARWCALCATHPSWIASFLPCASLSSSADLPLFFVQC